MCTGACGSQKRKPDLLSLELLVVLRMWVLGQNSGRLEEQRGLFTAKPSLRPFVGVFMGTLLYFIGHCICFDDSIILFCFGFTVTR